MYLFHSLMPALNGSSVSRIHAEQGKIKPAEDVISDIREKYGLIKTKPNWEIPNQ